MFDNTFLPEFFETDQPVDIQTLVSSRLEDLAEQVAFLYERGDTELADLLRQEGLELAESYDNGYIFLFINDLSLIEE